MGKLKLEALNDDKPVKTTVDLPAGVHRDFVTYAEALGRGTGQGTAPSKLIAPMLARFMTTDREFLKRRRAAAPPARADAPSSGNA